MADHLPGDSMENTVAAYLLGAVEPEEADLVRAHLESCSSCRELAARLRRVTAVLPLAVEVEQPPDRLRQRILAAAGAPPPVAAAPVRRHPLRVFRGVRGPRLRPSMVAAALLAVAVLGLGGWNVYLTRQLQESRAAVTSSRLDAASPTLSQTTGRVVALRSQGVIFIDFKNMPQPAPGRVYELWLGTGSGRFVPAGVFRPDADGSKLVLLNQDVSSYSIVALTVEQGPDGAPAPTQAPGMSGRL